MQIMVLDYNKSILSENFNPSKFDFNPWDLEKHLEIEERDPNKKEEDAGGPTISFWLYNSKCFHVKKGDILGCAELIPTGSQRTPCGRSLSGRKPNVKSGTPCSKLSHPGPGHADHGLAPH